MPSTDRRSPVDRLRDPFDRRPLAREGLIAALAFGAFALWIQVLWELGILVAARVDVSRFADAALWRFAASALASGVVVVAGTICFAAAYARVRDLSVPLSTPDAGDLPLVAAVVLVPAAAITAVYGLTSRTGTTMSSILRTSVGADPQLVFVVVLTALSLFVGLPTYVLLAHVVVQRTLRRAAGSRTAVGLTTLLIGLTGPTDVVRTGLPQRTVFVTFLLAAAIALPVFAAESFEREWLPWLCAVPLALFAAGFVADWLGGMGGIAEAAFALVEVGIVALGATAYERTDSLLLPALAYAVFVAAGEAVVVLFEAGVPP